MLSRKERELLKEAGSIIVRELLAGESVGIHHFGRFYVSEIAVARGIYNSEDQETAPVEFPAKVAKVVRFRPWEHLKNQIKSNSTKESVSTEDNKVEKSMVHCPHCGESIEVASEFCSACGLPPMLA